MAKKSFSGCFLHWIYFQWISDRKTYGKGLEPPWYTIREKMVVLRRNGPKTKIFNKKFKISRIARLSCSVAKKPIRILSDLQQNKLTKRNIDFLVMPMESIKSYRTSFLIQYAKIHDRIKIRENNTIFKFLSFKNSSKSFLFLWTPQTLETYWTNVSN